MTAEFLLFLALEIIIVTGFIAALAFATEAFRDGEYGIFGFMASVTVVTALVAIALPMSVVQGG